MAEEPLSLHIDTDWKKQAQEEKRKLAEQASKAKPASSGTAVIAPSTDPTPGAPSNSTSRRARSTPQAGIPSLVQSIMTQILYYLGELGNSSGAAGTDLDLAKHHLDTLTALEEKTKNNLTPEEQTVLDTALYETRTRFVSVASQMLGP